jgi:hypothetical protein
MGRGNAAIGRNQTVMGQYAEPTSKSVMVVGAGTSPANQYNAVSVGNDGIFRQGGGSVVTEVDGSVQEVYEEVNGELVKITI